MAKLKGKTGRQKVTVEHVHVHKGGQANTVASKLRPATAAAAEEQRRNKDLGSVAGIVNVSFRVPIDTASGSAVPLVLLVGDSFSQPVSIAIK